MTAKTNTKRPGWHGGPPADGSASSAGGIRFTTADIATFAVSAGLPLKSDTSRAADALAEIIDWHVIAARMQGTHSERATAPEWGMAVAEWATKGRILLGDDRGDVVHLTQASFHLCNALPPVGSHEEAALIGDIFMATGLHPSGITDLNNEGLEHTKTSVVALSLQNLAYTLRALQLLGNKIELNGAIKGKQVDYARLALVRNMGKIFVELFPVTPFNVVTRRKSDFRMGERGAFADGPAVRWCRAVLTIAPERLVMHSGDSLPEISELRDWAAKPDALPKVIRKLNAKPSTKLARQKR